MDCSPLFVLVAVRQEAACDVVTSRGLHALVRLTPGDEAVTIRSFFATVSAREALFEKRRKEVDRGI